MEKTMQIILWISLAIAALMPNIALAESSNQMLLDELHALKQRIEELETKLAKQESVAEKSINAKDKESILAGRSLDNLPVAVTDSYASEDYIAIPEYEENKFIVSGYVQHDTAFFADERNGKDYGSTIRNMRLAVSGVALGDWLYKIENNFAENRSKINSAFIAYRGFDNVFLRAGHFAQAFGLEGATSGRDKLFLEDNPSNILSPDTNLGWAFTYSQPRYTVGGGISLQDTSGGTVDEKHGWTMRATGLPIDDGTHLVHLGASGSIRRANDAATLRYNERPESKLLPDFVDTGDISNVKHLGLVGVDAAYQQGPFGIEGEYAHSQLIRPAREDLSFSGGYVQMHYTLTGEARGYDRHIGGFTGLKPSKNFDWQKGQWGAWEVAARYNFLDLNDKSVLGGRMQNYGCGLNWYPNNYIRVMTDYMKVDTDSHAVVSNNDPHLFMIRLQAGF